MVTASMSTQEVQSWTRFFYCGNRLWRCAISPNPQHAAKGKKETLLEGKCSSKKAIASKSVARIVFYTLKSIV